MQGLFDVAKFIREHPKHDSAIPHKEVFDRLKTIVDGVIATSKYNKVDLGALFSFMD